MLYKKSDCIKLKIYQIQQLKIYQIRQLKLYKSFSTRALSRSLVLADCVEDVVNMAHCKLKSQPWEDLW